MWCNSMQEVEVEVKVKGTSVYEERKSSRYHSHPTRERRS